MNDRMATFAALLSSGLLTLSAHATGYVLKPLGPITDDKNSYGEALHPSGLVVGESYVRQTCPLSQWVGCLVDGYTTNQPRSVWWAPGSSTPTPLACLSDTPPTSTSWDKPCEGHAINSRGVIVGRSYVAKGAFSVQQKPVLWLAATGSPIDLSPQLQGLPAYVSARAVDINEQGWILGSAQVDAQQHYAFLLRDGMAVVLPSAGAMSVKAKAIGAAMAVGDGLYDKGGQIGALLWMLGGQTLVLRSVDGTDNDVHAEGISSAGHVAGYYWAPASKQGNRAYVWYQGRTQILPTEPGYSSVAYSVNGMGQVAGSHCRTDQDILGCAAVVWSNGVRQDLNALATAPQGFTLVQAKAINDQGQITGWMVNANHLYRGFLLIPRP
jgi:uncharacterized membrane protein